MKMKEMAAKDGSGGSKSILSLKLCVKILSFPHFVVCWSMRPLHGKSLTGHWHAKLLLAHPGFDRHKLIGYCSMGVPLAVKKDDGSVVDDDDSQAGAILTGMAAADAADKNKKRKR